MLRKKLGQSFGPTEFTSLVWRGARRHPSEIFNTGFEKPKTMTNDSVIGHLKVKGSAYVAVRRTLDDALRFTPMDGFMYVMNLPEIYADAHAIYNAPGMNEPHCANIGTFENELAAACHVTGADIYKAKQWSRLEPGEGFLFAEPAYMNSNYRPRDWSFEILSKNTFEAENYEKELHQTGELPENERVITFKEAEKAAEAFRREFKDIIVPFDSPVAVIKTLPASLKGEDAVVDYALNLHAERVKSRGFSSRVSTISMFTPKKTPQVERGAASSLKSELASFRPI